MSDAVEISFRADLAELESGAAEAVSLLTEPNIGLKAVRVRIRTVAEQDHGSLEFEAEEMP